MHYFIKKLQQIILAVVVLSASGTCAKNLYSYKKTAGLSALLVAASVAAQVGADGVSRAQSRNLAEKLAPRSFKLKAKDFFNAILTLENYKNKASELFGAKTKTGASKQGFVKSLTANPFLIAGGFSVFAPSLVAWQLNIRHEKNEKLAADKKARDEEEKAAQLAASDEKIKSARHGLMETLAEQLRLELLKRTPQVGRLFRTGDRLAAAARVEADRIRAEMDEKEDQGKRALEAREAAAAERLVKMEAGKKAREDAALSAALVVSPFEGLKGTRISGKLSGFNDIYVQVVATKRDIAGEGYYLIPNGKIVGSNPVDYFLLAKKKFGQMIFEEKDLSTFTHNA